MTRTEDKIDHFWQEGEAVVGNIRANNFSARYTTTFTATRDGNITLELDADDGYKLLLNGREEINTWTRNRLAPGLIDLIQRKIPLIH